MERECSRCHTRKGESEFYASNRSWCKACIRADSRARRDAKRTPREQLPEGFKRCPPCGRVLPLAEFRPRSNGRPYSYCHACQRVANEASRRKRVAKKRERLAAGKRRGIRRPTTIHERGPLGSKWAEWRTTGLRLCPKCGDRKPIDDFYRNRKTGKPFGWCRACQYAAHRKWMRTDAGRASTNRYNRNPERRRRNDARVFTQKAIALGILVPQPCEVCGVTKVHAHHTDYSKPLEVRWLCHEHHKAEHRKETR